MDFLTSYTIKAMSSRTLPASPNWYNSKVSDVSDKHFVFGARQSVHVYRFDSSVAQCLQPFWTFTEHRDRVTSVTLSHHAVAQSSCCSADEEGKVKVWNVVGREVIQEHKKHSCKVLAVSWSPVDVDLIVSGDEKGGVVQWRQAVNKQTLITPESGVAIFSLACSTVDQDIVAIGYKTGLILLISLENRGEVVHRLRGHDDEVHSLSWSSFPGEAVGGWRKSDNEQGDAGCLLASGCKDRTVTVWSTCLGKALETFKLPMNTGSQRPRWDEQGRTRVWVTVCWPSHSRTQFISSSHNGDVLIWDISKPGRNKWELLSSPDTAGHSRIVFNISCGGDRDQYLISTSMDRQIVVWSLERQGPCFVLPSLGGFVYSVESSPFDPGQLAIGVGDNLIRVWNLSDPKSDYSVTTLWQGIKSKVTSLSWHPTKEGCLAYGTDDGRVGIYNICSNKPPQLSSTYHRRTVYVVTWGPPCPPLESKNSPAMCVYSVGDGLIKEHLPQRLDSEAVDVHNVISKTNGKKLKYPIRSEIRWRQDFSMVAIGNDDGSVEIYLPPDLRLVAVIRLHQKLVNCIRWHPLFTAASPTASPCGHWIATGSNENMVHVVDLSQLIDGLTSTEEVMTLTSSIAQLEGHSNRITGLSWSPHDDGQLVSASYDGTAQVWDVLQKAPVANYRGHSGKLLCAEWSPLEDKLIITGGDDFSLQLWDISQQEHKSCPPAKRKNKSRGKGKQKVDRVDEVVPPIECCQELPSEVMDLLENKRRELLQEKQTVDSHEDVTGLNQIVETSLTAEEICGEISTKDNTSDNSLTVDQPEGVQPGRRSTETRKRRRAKSTFPVLSARENCSRQQQHADILSLVERIYNPPCLSGDDSHLGLYLGRRDLYALLKKEAQYHLDHDNMEYHLQLEVWKGNISKALKVAQERDELSDWLVAMAPMASHQMWVDACVDYANQLEGEGQFHKAASYFLAAHKVYDAINLFRRHRMLREAVGVAKLRLSPLDAIHEELYTSWGEMLTKEGQFEQAAKCYVAIKQIREAAKLVARRGDEASLRTAAHMNFIARENQEGLVYTQKVLYHYLVAEDWGKIREFCGESPQLKVFILLSSLHELLLEEITKIDSGLTSVRAERKTDSTLLNQASDDQRSNIKIPEFIVDMSESDLLSPWKPHLVGNQTFVQSVLRLWCVKYQIPMDVQSLEEMYRVLHSVHHRQSSSDTQQLLIQVSYELSQALLSLLLGDTPTSIRHFTFAVSSLQISGHTGIMQALCQLCLPLGPKYVLKLQHEVTALRVLLNIDNSSPYTASTKSHTTKKYWCEAKEEDLISNSGHRCRELDCLRAYYYLAVLYHIQGELNKENSGTCGKSVQLLKPELILESQGETTISSNTDNSCDTCEGSKASNAPESIARQTSDISHDSANVSQSLNELDIQKTAVSETKSDLNSEQLSESERDLIHIQTIGNSTGDTYTVSEIPVNVHPELTLTKLKNLSKSVLWDIQGKRFALTETLAYVHKAMSKLLLNQTSSLVIDKTESPGQIRSHLNKVHPLTHAHGDGEITKSDTHLRILPPDVVLGLPEDSIPLRGVDDYGWQSPSNDLIHTPMLHIPSPFHDYVKPKKVLWKDDSVPEGTRRRSVDFSSPHEHVGIPSNWCKLPVDERYIQSYITQEILLQEEEFIKGELLRGPDTEQMLFPKPLSSVEVLLDISRRATFCSEEKSWIQGKLMEWALFFSVTSADRELFKHIIQNKQ